MEEEKIVITLWGKSFEIVHKRSNSKYDIHRIYDDGSYTRLSFNIKSVHRCLEIIEEEITTDFKYDIVILNDLKVKYLFNKMRKAINETGNQSRNNIVNKYTL